VKSRYEQRIGPGLLAWVTLTKHQTCWSIDMVSVPPECRKSGLGRKILGEVIREADEESVVLVLEALSCGGLDQRDLEAFYERLGFKKIGRRGVFGPVMARDPR